MKDYRPEIRSLLRRLRAHGFSPLSVNNGEETIQASSLTATQFLEEIVGVDDSTLIFKDKKGDKFVVSIILGNDPGEAPADYTEAEELEEIMEEHYERWVNKKQPTI